jgi:hypothetical protein
MAPYRLGKLPRRNDRRTLRFSHYLKAGLAPAPAEVTYEQKVTAWPMMLNDTEGDCTIAAAGHMIEDWTANANPPPVVVPDPDIQSAYNAVDGGVDQGADMLTVLKYWRSAGIGGHGIAAFAQLDLPSVPELEQSVFLFGASYIGLSLPNFVVNASDMLAVPWVVPPGGATGPDAAPNPASGHCVPVLGYDAQNLYVVTWGTVKAMGRDFYAAYTDEAYAVLSPDWISPGGTAPAGFDMTQLQADLLAVTQAPAPAPTPAPVPPPNPCYGQIELGAHAIEAGEVVTGLQEVLDGVWCLVSSGKVEAGTLLRGFIERARKHRARQVA